jgi:hypothetical protein
MRHEVTDRTLGGDRFGGAAAAGPRRRRLPASHELLEDARSPADRDQTRHRPAVIRDDHLAPNAHRGEIAAEVIFELANADPIRCGLMIYIHVAIIA